MVTPQKEKALIWNIQGFNCGAGGISFADPCCTSPANQQLTALHAAIQRDTNKKASIFICLLLN